MKKRKEEYLKVYYDFKGEGLWHMTLVFLGGESGGMHIHHLNEGRQEIFQIWLSKEDISKVHKMLHDAWEMIKEKEERG